MSNAEYDVFISHASEDKDVFVRPLAERLLEMDLRVWYDELSLELGDSLRQNIDLGLSASKYGVVVLSPAFFEKQWPERELNGLVQKAIVEGRKVILPVWHNVSHGDVAKYSLPLADLLAARSDAGPDSVARAIASVVRGTASTPAGAAARTIHSIADDRALYSKKRLEALSERLADLRELNVFADLAIFATGSYGRLEASEYSDIDLFFVAAGSQSDIQEPRTTELRLFGKMLEIIGDLRFPKFSSDCQYLEILHSDDIVQHLGSPIDDYRNCFTARLLLLLESRCLYGQEQYDLVLDAIIKRYFKDYGDHRRTFQPVFLLNDICRFWKTLLLNYEVKRSADTAASPATADKTQEKIRNYKLKYSRMTTCFATICALGSYVVPVTEQQVSELVALTPRQRLEDVTERIPAVRQTVDDVLDEYNWFLEMTGLSIEELEDCFADKQKRIEMFARANQYGDLMYKLLCAIELAEPSTKMMRYLVI